MWGDFLQPPQETTLAAVIKIRMKSLDNLRAKKSLFSSMVYAIHVHVIRTFSMF